jgi:hypothetical protein
MEKLPNIKDIKPLPDSNLEHLIFAITKIASSYNTLYTSYNQEPEENKLEQLKTLRDTQVVYYQELERELQKN